MKPIIETWGNIIQKGSLKSFEMHKKLGLRPGGTQKSFDLHFVGFYFEGGQDPLEKILIKASKHTIQYKLAPRKSYS